MFGSLETIYVLEDLYGLKAALNHGYEPDDDDEYIDCLTDLLFDPDDVGHSCYMLLNLDTSEDEAEKQWWIEHDECEPGSPYWYHHNRVRAIEYIKANIPNDISRVLVHISY